MACGFIAVDDALVNHAVDHRGGGRKGGGSFVVLAIFQRQRRFTDGATQLRGEPVVAYAVRRRLSRSFFSRFCIRQGQTPSKPCGPNRTPKEPRSLPNAPALVNYAVEGTWPLPSAITGNLET